jgi:hypothetical protein
MLGNEAQAASPNQVLKPATYASAAAASSNFIDARGYEGDILIIQNSSVVSGALTAWIEDASDTAGTNAASANTTAFSSHGASSNVQMRTVDAKSIKGFLRYRGIPTGSALISVMLLGRPKNIV